MANKKEKDTAEAVDNAQAENSTEETKAEETAEEVDVSIEEAPKEDELEKLKKEIDKQKDLALRTAAEFDNYKKRTEREKASSLEFMKADIVKTFLPMIDNFSRALEADPSGEDFKKGIEMISKQLTDIMVKLGLSEINDEGKEFDPQFHQAVLHTEDENVGENIIIKTLQKGYKLGDTVIRPAMVQVAN